MTQDWIEFNPKTGRIPRRFTSNQEPQPQSPGNLVVPMAAQKGQKLVWDGLDDKGKPINPRLVKDEDAHKARKPIPPEEELIVIRRGDWEKVLTQLGIEIKEIGG